MHQHPHVLHIDIETYSGADLKKTGVYRYASDPDFQVLLIAYAYDDGPVHLIDMTPYTELQGEEFGDALDEHKFFDDYCDLNIIKVAHNAAFERICLSALMSRSLGLNVFSRPEQWRCTMVHATELGMPASLKQLAIWMGTDHQKDASGTRLINKFSKPDKNGKRLLPDDDPDGWEQFKEYCIQDVRTEQAIYTKLQQTPLPDSEWQLWELDQYINDRGFCADWELINSAKFLDGRIRKKLIGKLKDLTGVDNPLSVAQLGNWIQDQGMKLPNLLKSTVMEAVTDPDLPSTVREVLETRILAAGAATKKYEAFTNMKNNTGKIHGTLQFYGAGRTGRWAGRGVQIHNLPRSTVSVEELDQLRHGVRNRSEHMTGEDLKQIVRTVIVPDPGEVFIVSDFRAIEAITLAWLSGESWVLDAFRRGDDLYEVMASKMLHIPLEEITKEQRAKGKIAVLACGYQGGVGALKRMGGEKMGLKDHEMSQIVQQWRSANSWSVKLWRDVERAVKSTLLSPSRTARVKVGKKRFLQFEMKESGALFITLPSERSLVYQHMSQSSLEGGGLSFFSRGLSGAMVKEETYGGKLVENIVQATARDILAHALMMLNAHKFKIVMHIHDEIVVSVDKEELKPNPLYFGMNAEEAVEVIMARVPRWATGLPLAAETFVSDYYRKG